MADEYRTYTDQNATRIVKSLAKHLFEIDEPLAGDSVHPELYKSYVKFWNSIDQHYFQVETREKEGKKKSQSLTIWNLLGEPNYRRKFSHCNISHKMQTIK